MRLPHIHTHTHTASCLCVRNAHCRANYGLHRYFIGADHTHALYQVRQVCLFCAMMTTATATATTVPLSRFFNSQNLRLFVVLRKHTDKCLTRANNSNINSNSNQIKYYSAPHLTAPLACLHACMHVCFAVYDGVSRFVA